MWLTNFQHPTSSEPIVFTLGGYVSKVVCAPRQVGTSLVPKLFIGEMTAWVRGRYRATTSKLRMIRLFVHEVCSKISSRIQEVCCPTSVSNR